MRRSLALILGLAAVESGASTLYVSSSRLYQADLVQGKHVLIGDWGLGYQPELASDWRGESFRLWTVTFNGVRSSLKQIDPITAQVISSKSIVGDASGQGLRTLAFDAITGSVFATGIGSSDALYRIDPDTGNGQLMGSIGGNLDVYGLAFDLAGNLWATADDLTSFSPVRYVLLKINPSNASVISKIELSPNVFVPTDIAFRPEDGRLFAIAASSGNGALFGIDVGTGVETGITMTGADASMGGLAFGPVPEPAGVIWVCGGLNMLGRRNRRRCRNC